MNNTFACRPLFVGKKSIGDRYDKSSLFVFFGNRHFNETEMDRCFPEVKRAQLKQVHSDICHDISPSLPGGVEGDSQITSYQNIALTVYTADCLPILAYDPGSNKIAGIHAGWRGLTKNIIEKTLSRLNCKDASAIQIWIGPHIHKNSFEVGEDVAQQLNDCSHGQDVVFKHTIDQNKRLVDLTKIALAQLSFFGVDSANVWVHPVDTLRNPEYYSYRRDGKGGRLLSFIYRI